MDLRLKKYLRQRFIIIPHLFFKGTHARDFHSLFLTFCCIIHPLINTKHSIANIFDNLFQIRQEIRNFRSPPIFAESAWHTWTLLSKICSDTESFCQKLEVKWCIFGDNVVFAKIRLSWWILNSVLKIQKSWTSTFIDWCKTNLKNSDTRTGMLVPPQALLQGICPSAWN